MPLFRSLAPAVFAWLVLAVGCAGVAQYVVTAAPPARPALRVFVEDIRVVGVLDALQACRYWRPVGVECQIARTPQEADIVIKTDYTPALALARSSVAARKKGEMGPPKPLKPGCKIEYPKPQDVTDEDCIAGLANLSTNVITIFAECMRRPRGSSDYQETVIRVLAHELGHQMGLDHVPLDCDDPCVDYAVDAKGAKICGPAIMNSPSVRADYITPADAAQFSVRLKDRAPRDAQGVNDRGPDDGGNVPIDFVEGGRDETPREKTLRSIPIP